VRRLALWLALAAGGAWAQTADNVLVVVNLQNSLSRRVGDYYVHCRQVPLKNLCRVSVSPAETITLADYEKLVEEPILRYLRSARLVDKILYIVTTQGVPLRVSGPGEGPRTESAALDSELALLYSKIKGKRFPRAGAVPNPFYEQRKETFAHPRFPIYLVTRLAGYDFDDIKAMMDRSLVARNRGKFVIDLKSSARGAGDDWLRLAASQLPLDRLVLDETEKVLYGERDVIGYAAWGSNDPNRHQRFTGFHWLPGAIVTEYVSSNGRTFARPPEDWTISTWRPADRLRWFAGSPQTLTADYIHEGATGCSGHVDEPYLSQTPRPDYLLPAYFGGRNLAESYYLAIPSLSWQNIVVGDPLCRLK
jgi:uncharacterized protein (TIGR03790 family)